MTDEDRIKQSMVLSLLKLAHGRMVFNRRVHVLSEVLAEQIPAGAEVLDIGCGDGTIGSLLAEKRRDISIKGVEIMTRPSCRIRCRTFDGENLPFASSAFDLCLIVDVLHHTKDVAKLLREAARVSRKYVLLKDHLSESALDFQTLKLMDWVGNRPHGVTLPHNYQSKEAWETHFRECGLAVNKWTTEVPLYPFPFSAIVGRKLHFVALLEKA